MFTRNDHTNRRIPAFWAFFIPSSISSRNRPARWLEPFPAVDSKHPGETGAALHRLRAETPPRNRHLASNVMENPAPKDATWRVSKVPPGSTKTVVCVKRSGKMNRFCKVGTLKSGGPECAPAEAVRRPKANGDQPKGDVTWTFRESDPPIVVRDGNAGHKAKEWAGKQRKHSPHHGIRILPNTVSRFLLATGAGSGTLCRRWFQMRAFLRSPVR